MVTIIDYGMGNLRSVQKACQKLGYEAVISDHSEEILRAQAVILPGVGAFEQAMHRLKSTGLDKTVLRTADRGTPLLGICLGMQLMFRSSSEGGLHKGLGLIKSDIRQFKSGVKVPHMGWNTIIPQNNALFEGIKPDSYVYFVHSFCAPEINNAWTGAVCDYNGPFSAAVAQGNVFATQFHPEKSGDVGLQILGNFLKMGETEC